MSYITISADVDIDDVMDKLEDSDIVDAVRERELEFEFQSLDIEGYDEPYSLDDKIKLETVLKHYKKKSLNEIETFFGD